MKVKYGGYEFNVQDEPKDFWSWVENGNYDKEWNIINRFLKPEHTFIDLGAWVGSHSLLASNTAKRVIACEPDPVAANILQLNLARRSKCQLTNNAVGIDGTVKLGSGFLGASTTRLNPNAGGGIGAWEEGQQFEAVSHSLRTYCEMMKVEDPMFIKMDVEGSEEEILKDLEFFAEHKPTLYLENHSFWWKDEAKAWRDVKRVAGLYKHAYDLWGQPVNTQSSYFKAVILTDEEI
jgi:FkbM family methyltransferase